MRIKSLLYLIATAMFMTSATVQTWGVKPENSVSGRAFVVKAKVAGLINATIVDTGPLPDVGGTLEENLATLSIPGLISADLLHAMTSGGGNGAQSEAELANLLLTVAGIEVAADLVTARTEVYCDYYGKAKVLLGDAQITKLTINGVPIEVTGAGNQTTTITVPLVGTVKVVLEEKKKISSGMTDVDITVNALHITVTPLGHLLPVADVIISSAHSDIFCGKPPVDP